LPAVEPGFFGLGTLPANWQAPNRDGCKVGDVDRYEGNEAFAAAIAVCDGLKIDLAWFNVDCGAILVAKAAHALQRAGEKRAVVSP